MIYEDPRGRLVNCIMEAKNFLLVTTRNFNGGPNPTNTWSETVLGNESLTRDTGAKLPTFSNELVESWSSLT